MDETEYDRVFVAGASGATGKAVLELLGPRSPTVRALTRSSDAGTELRRAGADSTFEVVSTPQFPDRGLAIDWRLPGDRDG